MTDIGPGDYVKCIQPEAKGYFGKVFLVTEVATKNWPCIFGHDHCFGINLIGLPYMLMGHAGCCFTPFKGPEIEKERWSQVKDKTIIPEHLIRLARS